jgi:hypothetical protein
VSADWGRSFEIRTGSNAREATDFFNAFHDGFIKSFEVLSDDEFEDIGVHAVTGPLTLVIEFAHYNYDEGRTPAGRRIEARFERVRLLELSFSGGESDWPITAFEVDEDESGQLGARLLQARFEDGEYETVTAMTFRCESARYREYPDT